MTPLRPSNSQPARPRLSQPIRGDCPNPRPRLGPHRFFARLAAATPKPLSGAWPSSTAPIHGEPPGCCICFRLPRARSKGSHLPGSRWYWHQEVEELGSLLRGETRPDRGRRSVKRIGIDRWEPFQAALVESFGTEHNGVPASPGLGCGRLCFIAGPEQVDGFRPRDVVADDPSGPQPGPAPLGRGRIGDFGRKSCRPSVRNGSVLERAGGGFGRPLIVGGRDRSSHRSVCCGGRWKPGHGLLKRMVIPL